MQAAQSYTCYLIDDETRKTLSAFARGHGFARKRGHHITELYDADSMEGLRDVRTAEVYGMATDHKGIEAFLVRIGGEEMSRDGRYYHLTWSMDPRAEIPDFYRRFEMNPEAAPGPIRYGSRHANAMLMAAFEHAAGFVTVLRFPAPLVVPVTPAFVHENGAGLTRVKYLAPA